MLVLALDTTSEKGGVGIYRDLDCLASVANEGPANIYSISLFEMVERALGQVKLGLGDVDLFAVANGPGSFTGIRVGLAATQAWAKAFSRPAGAVSLLEALVEEARPETDWAVPILDARRGEFFVEIFRRLPPGTTSSQGPFTAEEEGWVVRPPGLVPFLAERLPAGVTCLVREHEQAALALRDNLPNSYGWQCVPGTLVGAISRLALKAHQQGRTEPPAVLDAYYIRRPDAELNWRE